MIALVLGLASALPPTASQCAEPSGCGTGLGQHRIAAQEHFIRDLLRPSSAAAIVEREIARRTAHEFHEQWQLATVARGIPAEALLEDGARHLAANRAAAKHFADGMRQRGRMELQAALASFEAAIALNPRFYEAIEFGANLARNSAAPDNLVRMAELSRAGSAIGRMAFFPKPLRAPGSTTFSVVHDGSLQTADMTVSRTLFQRTYAFEQTRFHKVEHDVEQLELLAARGLLPAIPYVDVLRAYRQLLASARALAGPALEISLLGQVGINRTMLQHSAHFRESFDTYPRGSHEQLMEAQYHAALLDGTFNRQMYVRPWQHEGPMLQHWPNRGAIDAAFHAEGSPRITVLDNFFTEAALHELHDYLLESTIWTDSNHNSYLGAYWNHGLAPEGMARAGQELRAALPATFASSNSSDQRLTGGGAGAISLCQWWAYKYDQKAPNGGITTHADPAVLTVNIWITPDSASLDTRSRDPTTGSGADLAEQEGRNGLLIFHKVPKDGWGANQISPHENPDDIDTYVRSGMATRVPYKANRAVIFDSRLFHKSDIPAKQTQRGGYINRRINLALLFAPDPNGESSRCAF